jgi:hypothetical protein
MPTPAKRLLLTAIVLLWAQSGAVAHNIGESNATFYVRTTGIDVELYMGLNSAARLLGEDGQVIGMNPNNFADYSDRLAALAPDLLTLTGGDGTTLKPDAMTVSMTETTDVFYALHYPLPSPMPGVLKIHADYLDKMVDTHVGTIYVMNTVGDPFGWGTVSPDSQDLQVRLPAIADIIKNHAAAAVVANPPSDVANSQHGGRWVLWTVLGAGVLVVAGVILRRAGRQHADRPMTH